MLAANFASSGDRRLLACDLGGAGRRPLAAARLHDFFRALEGHEPRLGERHLVAQRPSDAPPVLRGGPARLEAVAEAEIQGIVVGVFPRFLLGLGSEKEGERLAVLIGDDRRPHGRAEYEAVLLALLDATLMAGVVGPDPGPVEGALV